ncbi:MAG: hypothetical protein KGJ77_00405 [Acidobacteriota bacterium]|nr:hypothetical protein [Acidobacteriota bacterium]
MSGPITSSTETAVQARQAELLRAGRPGHRLPATSRRPRRGRPAALRLVGDLLVGTGRWLGGAERGPGRGRLANSCS